jgi:hypothetical protein
MDWEIAVRQRLAVNTHYIFQAYTFYDNHNMYGLAVCNGGSPGLADRHTSPGSIRDDCNILPSLILLFLLLVFPLGFDRALSRVRSSGYPAARLYRLKVIFYFYFCGCCQQNALTHFWCCNNAWSDLRGTSGGKAEQG